MPFDHHGRVLDLRDIRHGKDPARSKVRDVVLIDLGKFGVAVSAGVAIVGGPIGFRCHQPVAVARFAEQSDLFVVRAELKIERALVEDLAFQRLAGGELDLPANDDRRRGARHRRERAEMRHQVGHVPGGQIESGHAGCRAPGAQERGKFRGAARGDLRLDVGTAFAAGGVAAVAACAAYLIFAASGIGLGGDKAEDCEQEKGETHCWHPGHDIRFDQVRFAQE